MPLSEQIRQRERTVLLRSMQIFDLDEAQNQKLDLWRHVEHLNLDESFIHDMIIFQNKNQKYLAKGEDVFETLQECSVRDYSSFDNFVFSLFAEGEAIVPIQTVKFPDEPELSDLKLYYSDIVRKWESIKKVCDQTSLGEISDPEIRRLVVLYRQEKEQLINMNQDTLVNIFNHHGRDIINEYLASALAYVLDVYTPENFLGVKKIHYWNNNWSLLQDGVERFIVSQALCESLPCSNLKTKLLDCVSCNVAEIRQQLSLNWHNANPFRVLSGSSVVRENQSDLRDLVKKNFLYYKDLIKSDIFDHFLSSYQDRKIEEFLVPNGQEGHIYTIDYGEVFFPELELDLRDSHYIAKKKENFDSFFANISQIAQKEDPEYKKVVSEFIVSMTYISTIFIKELVAKIPGLFFQYYWDQARSCYNPKTIIDYILSFFAVVRKYFDLRVEYSPEENMQRVQNKLRRIPFDI